MKLRNVRRRQWERYVTRLEELRRRLPARTLTAHADIWKSRDAIIVAYPTYLHRARRDAARWGKRSTHRWRRTARWVEHDCVWEPTDLRIDAAGNTRPGFVCTYELENGQGQCGSNVFAIEDAIGRSACVVYKGGEGW